MNQETENLISKYPHSFDRCISEISHGNNIHRGFGKDEIMNSLNNPNEFTGGIKAELQKELNGNYLYLKVWYSEEYYVGVAC